MKSLVLAAVFSCSLAACSTFSTSPAQRGQPASQYRDYSVSLVLGRSEYNEDWEPLEDVDVIGAEVAKITDSGTGPEFGISYGSESGTFSVPTIGLTNVDIDHGVFFGGVRHTWDLDGFHPYIGAGVEINYVEVEAQAPAGLARDDDAALGLYVHVGLQFDLDPVGESFLAIDARKGGVGADYNVGPAFDVDADYERLSLLIGFRF